MSQTGIYKDDSSDNQSAAVEDLLAEAEDANECNYHDDKKLRRSSWGKRKSPGHPRRYGKQKTWKKTKNNHKRSRYISRLFLKVTMNRMNHIGCERYLGTYV